jgi:DNA mismatch repair protein MutS2
LSAAGISERTLRHLEWSRLQQAWFSRCRGEAARRSDQVFAEDAAAARRALGETREALQLIGAGDPLPLEALRDIAPHIERLERGGVLDAAGLADIRVALQQAGKLRRFLGGRRDTLPELWKAAAFDASLDALDAQLADAVELDGTLRDAASSELARLRSEIGGLRQRIVGRLQDVIDKHGDLLSDTYFTLREGRYVLPVRRDAHDRLPGIVHGESSSGASIFVEPRGVVEHGNRLKMAEAEREREELRILGALSELVAERAAPLRAAEQSLNRLDLRNAAALLGKAYRGTVPELLDDARLSLKAARHPTLSLELPNVVANDMSIAAGYGLVISGPNAGGKTVVLKTLGLCALMARAGLPLPAAEGSAIGFFGSVLSELGDEQSTATNLSTFSAHVSHVASMLEDADDRSLVLLDELATGTDPGEGAALACALVDAFCKRGAALVVTTHYEALKAYAEHDPRLRSASVGLEAERLSPTFELLLDVPGASSALIVAARFGLPADVIELAQRMLPEQAREFERLSRSLSEAVSQARAQSSDLLAERASLEAKRREYESLLAEQREQGRRKISREAEQLMGELRNARSELSVARSQLRRGEDLASAQAKVNAAAARLAVGSSVDAALQEQPSDQFSAEPPELRVGGKVYVPRLRSEAVVVEGPQKNKVLVAVGAMKLWVDTKDLRTPLAAAAEPGVAARPYPSADTTVMRLPDNTVDVRGLRADDALAMLDSFIDRLYAGPKRVGYVLHGHGTSALRGAVREHLKTALPFIQDSRPGNESEGGDAVTVFFLD